tara:strand:+ start:588 stop:1379 length:792 start_codon:yes stop_codon:yes gene_type:complete
MFKTKKRKYDSNYKSYEPNYKELQDQINKSKNIKFQELKELTKFKPDDRIKLIEQHAIYIGTYLKLLDDLKELDGLTMYLYQIILTDTIWFLNYIITFILNNIDLIIEHHFQLYKPFFDSLYDILSNININYQYLVSETNYINSDSKKSMLNIVRDKIFKNLRAQKHTDSSWKDVINLDVVPNYKLTGMFYALTLYNDTLTPYNDTLTLYNDTTYPVIIKKGKAKTKYRLKNQDKVKKYKTKSKQKKINAKKTNKAVKKKVKK